MLASHQATETCCQVIVVERLGNDTREDPREASQSVPTLETFHSQGGNLARARHGISTVAEQTVPLAPAIQTPIRRTYPRPAKYAWAPRHARAMLFVVLVLCIALEAGS